MFTFEVLMGDECTSIESATVCVCATEVEVAIDRSILGFCCSFSMESVTGTEATIIKHHEISQMFRFWAYGLDSRNHVGALATVGHFARILHVPSSTP